MNQSNKIGIKTFFFIGIGIVIIFVFIIFFKTGLSVAGLDRLISLLGLITTCIAFLIGCYFALLAVDAYSHLQNIRNIENEISDKIKPVEVSLKDAERISSTTAKEMINLMDEFLSHQINFDQYEKRSSIIAEEMRGYVKWRRNSLLGTRARILIKHKFLNPDRRMNLIRELSEVGVASDLELLRSIADSVDESPEIRTMANRSFDLLEERVKKGKT